MVAVVVQGEDDCGHGGHNEDGDDDQLNVSQIEDMNDTNVSDGKYSAHFGDARSL